MIPVWLPVAVPWAGAALLAALPRRPAAVGPAVALASLAAAVGFAVWGDAVRPADALGVALLLAGALAALLLVVWDAGSAPAVGSAREDRFVAAGFPLLQGSQALALLATDAAVAWIGLAVGVGTGAAMVALASGGRRAFAAAWRMLLLCGGGLALALLGVALLHGGAAAPGLANVGFVLLLLGYAGPAGLAPLNAWLPRAAAVAEPPVAVLVAGLLPPAALHALLRAAEAAGPASVALPPAALLVAVGLTTAALAAVAAWRGPPGRVAVKRSSGWGGAGVAGLAAVGFGLGGAAGASAGVLLLLGLPFCVGAAVLGAVAGGPVAALLGRLSLAGMPPFAPFVALVSLLSAVAALPAAAALPLGAALLAVATAQLGAAARRGITAMPDHGVRRGGLLSAGPAWVLLGVAFALGAALPEAVAAALGAAAAGLAR